MKKTESSGEHRSKAYRFTLIELLVVIAIIAILAAILLPALQQARQRGLGTSCIGNCKTVGQTVQTYMNEYASYFPFHGGSWWYGLRYYFPSYKITDSGSPSVNGSGDENPRFEKMRNAPVFWCPALFIHPRVAKSKGETYYVPPSWQKHFGIGTGKPFKLTAVVRPGQKIMLVEYSFDGGGAAVTLPRYSNNAFPHAKNGNFTMLDGHVETQKYGLPWVLYSSSDNRSLFYKHWYPFKP